MHGIRPARPDRRGGGPLDLAAATAVKPTSDKLQRA
jgi:hypothetical protein